MQPFFRDRFGNPSSLHSDGIFARDALAKAREQFAAFINARAPEEILLTSNGTEAVNLAIKGTALANQKRGKHIVLSATEHPSSAGSVSFLESLGFTSTRVPVNEQGIISPENVLAAVQPDTILVAIHHANHDIGAIAPIQKIGELLADRGVPLFVDAVASAGWLPIDVQKMNASLLAFSPQRFHGPKGVGVLYRRPGARLVSIVHGGEQENGLRAGTENVPAIVGAGTAAEIASREFPARAAHATLLQSRLFLELQKIPHLRLNGPPPGPDRLPNNLNLSVRFVEGEGLALMLDVRGFAIGSGTSCVTRDKKIPPVLAAIGLDELAAKGTILITLGKDTTEDEITKFSETLPTVISTLREMSPEWEDFQRA
jgi:cysteine desulfurase